MKTRFLFFIAISGLVALSSCREENFGYSEEEIAYAKFEKEYNDNFERDYGKIAPGHTWGFDEVAETRAGGITRGDISSSTNYKVVRQTHTENGVTYYAKADHMPSNGANVEADRKFAQLSMPPAIQEAEQTAVFEFLREHPDENWSTTCNLDSYFLQDLGRYEHTFNYVKNDGTVHSSSTNQGHLDQLFIDGFHVNDYNAPNTNINNVCPTYYVTNTNLTNPYYKDSHNEATSMTNHYRFYYVPGYGLYLCFDYVSTKNNEKYDGDGIYDDWVIKVTPGASHRSRVFCEDLGSTLDLDFNDLVFDYYYTNYINISGYSGKTSIKVLALEGTLPIKIENKDLKVKTVNGQLVDDLLPHHVVDMPEFFVDGTDITKVKIQVKSGSMENVYCFIHNTRGKAPYLLKVAATAEWPAENQRIEKKYPTFSSFVQDPTSNPWWWNNFNN